MTELSGVKIGKEYISDRAFSALNDQGEIITWGNGGYSPSGGGYVQIYSSPGAFTARKADGTLASWGRSLINSPKGTGYREITTNGQSEFAAIDELGKVYTWGLNKEPERVENLSNVKKIVANDTNFVAITANGEIYAVDKSFDTPKGSGFKDVISSREAFTAISSEGSLITFGKHVREAAPSGSGYIKVVASWYAFTALNNDGTAISWGEPNGPRFWNDPPANSRFSDVYANEGMLPALNTTAA